MFEKPTVLVLGAGASVSYGYPTGEKLIENIKETIRTTSLRYLSYSSETSPLREIKEYRNLRDLLDFYDPISIDTFLKNHSHDSALVSAGKNMIAYEILKSEAKDQLNSSNSYIDNQTGKHIKGNWYRFLFAKLISTNSRYKTQLEVIRALAQPEIQLPLKIITFNYDISLEYFFYTRIHSASFINTDDKEKIWNKIKTNILHIYGDVSSNKHPITNYGNYHPAAKNPDNKTRLDSAEILSKKIWVMGEERGNENVLRNFESARDILKEAVITYFLGYGFNDDNDAGLKLGETCSNATQIYVSNYGSSKRIDDKCKEILFIKKNLNIQPCNVYNALADEWHLGY